VREGRSEGGEEGISKVRPLNTRLLLCSEISLSGSVSTIILPVERVLVARLHRHNGQNYYSSQLSVVKLDGK
jgi:hypothetical protein